MITNAIAMFWLGIILTSILLFAIAMIFCRIFENRVDKELERIDAEMEEELEEYRRRNMRVRPRRARVRVRIASNKNGS